MLEGLEPLQTFPSADLVKLVVQIPIVLFNSLDFGFLNLPPFVFVELSLLGSVERLSHDSGDVA